VIVACAIALLAVSADARVFVEPSRTSTLPAALRSLLAEELPKGSIEAARDRARWIVRVEDRRATIFVEAREQSGAIVVERTIDKSGGTLAALRVAVLLIREAVEVALATPNEEPTVAVTPTSTPTPPRESFVRTSTAIAIEPTRDDELPLTLTTNTETSTTSSDDEPNIPLEATPSLALFTWAQPFLPPQLAFGLAFHTRISADFRAGLSALLAGYGCCTRETGDATGNIRELLVLVEGEALLFNIGPTRAGLVLGLGFEHMFGEASALRFEGPPTPSPIAESMLLLEAAFAVRVPLNARTSLRLLAGTRVLLPRRTFSDPLNLEPREPLDTGLFTPFVSAGASFSIF
jgi:hypothetical protein